jgi:hypothetical protein
MTTYEVRDYPHGKAIFGPIPASDFGALTRSWSKLGYETIDLVIGQALGATLAVVRDEEASKAWRRELDIRFDHPDWLRSGDCGVSSRTIYGLLGDDRAGWAAQLDAPYDPADFGRCYRLVRRFGWRGRLHEVAARCPAWRPFVERWDDLCRQFEEEGRPDAVGFPTVERLPVLYEMIRQIREQDSVRTPR